MADTLATITRVEKGIGGDLTEGKKFLFFDGELKEAGHSTNVLSVSIDFPSEDDTEDSSFSLNLGTEETINLNYKLYHEDTDRSDGTDSNIETFSQIIPYLKRNIFKQAIGEVLYRIQMTTKFETIDAYYELQDFSLDTSDSIYPEGNLTFKFRFYANEE